MFKPFRVFHTFWLCLLFGISVGPAHAATGESIRTVQEQYVAFYGRPGDLAGIQYWADEMERQGGQLGAIQAAFADSDEFRTLIIPGDATSVAELSTEELRTMINNLYQNMFGRDGDSGGLDYWTDQLETGARSLVDISTAIADGAPSASEDRSILNNRVTLAQRISEAIYNNSLTYGNEQITTARSFLFTAIAATSADPLEVDISSLLASLGSTGNQLPVANAGADQTVTAGTVVILDGSASQDPDGSIQSYLWQQFTGVTLAKMQPRIINGAKASLGQFPWQVALLTDLNDSFNSQGCGGSIIHEKWILTAAHCYDPAVATTYVAAALTDLNSLNTEFTIKAKRWIVHADYDDQSLDNDIALIELESPLSLSACGSACAAISLVTQANAATVMPLGASALVSGWGNTVTEGEVFQPYLQWVQLSITGCTSGSALYASSDVTGNMFCAGVPNYDKDSCQGDSGGPLAVANGNSYLLAGVVSWGNGCAAQGYPGVFTKVANYTQWIQDNTAGACCSGGEDTSTGTTVQISNATSAKASFTAPQVTVSTKLSFELTVTDNAQGASSDRVDITVIPAN